MITNSASPMQRRGASSYAGTPPLGTTTLVAVGANTNGIVLRTILLAGNGTTQFLIAAGVQFIICNAASQFSYIGPGIVIPAGVALTIEVQQAVNGYAAISWDLL